MEIAFFFQISHYFKCNLHFNSLIKSPFKIIIIVIKNNSAILAKITSIQLAIFKEIKPTTDHTRPIIIKKNIGNKFFFCLLKSVYNKNPEIIKATKLIMLITSSAQPPTSNKSINKIIMQEYIDNFIN